MCGICGFIGPGSKRDIIEMANEIFYRGPDEKNFYEYQKKNVYLGHTRLSIVDINLGKQPMFNENGNVCLIYNGEIYNNLELRKILKNKGHIFKTKNSDTEVLLNSYLEWGIDCVNKFNGMFAFAIFDKNKNSLILGRDRLGEKPLFYFYDGNKFAFSSSISSIKKYIKNNKINQKALLKFYAYGFIPGKNTHIQNLYKLEPGNILEFKIDKKDINIYKYWKYTINEDTVRYFDLKNSKEEFLFLFEKSIKERLVADTNIGVMLSGGLDSSAVAIYAAKNYHKKINTYSVSFSEKSFDESYFFKKLSKELGLENISFNLTAKDNFENLNEIFQKLDETLADPSIVPTYTACKLAKKNVKVLLTGDGADELFCGYSTFTAMHLSRLLEKDLFKIPINYFNKFFFQKNYSEKYMSFNFKLNKLINGLNVDESIRNPVWLSHLDIKDIRDLFSINISPEELYSEAKTVWENSSSTDPIFRTSEFYINFYLPNNILSKVDKAGMYNSIEIRSPFLDYDLVDFTTKISSNLKSQLFTNKFLLKKSFKEILPNYILKRKKKGFAIPVSKWIEKKISSKLPNALIGNQKIFERFKENHLNKLKNYNQFLWGTLILNKIL